MNLIKLAAIGLAATLSTSDAQAKEVKKYSCDTKYSFSYELLDSKCQGETKSALDAVQSLPLEYIDAFNFEGGVVYIAKNQKSMPETWQVTYNRMLIAFKPQGYKKLYGFMFEEPEGLRLYPHSVILRNNSFVETIALHEFGHALNGALHEGLGYGTGILSERPDFMSLCDAYEKKKYKDKKMSCNYQTLSGSWRHNELWAEQFAQHYKSNRAREEQKRWNLKIHNYFVDLEEKYLEKTRHNGEHK